MTIRLDEFKQYMRVTNELTQGSQRSYVYYLGHANRLLNEDGQEGLDEILFESGSENLVDWANSILPSRYKKPPNIQAAIKKYIEFHDNENFDSTELSSVVSQSEPQVSVFNLEKDMQAAVRRQLQQLEAGLVEADGGREQSVSTGRIDILARDENGYHVVIELKAGRCPKGAIEQVLGYAYALKAERPEIEQVRSILIAGDFSEQTLAAARLIPSLTLKTYLFSLQFEDVHS